jgi:hypothetical protein
VQRIAALAVAMYTKHCDHNNAMRMQQYTTQLAAVYTDILASNMQIHCCGLLVVFTLRNIARA